jgi:prepilin-type processing-associated H-X9-DG protein
MLLGTLKRRGGRAALWLVVGLLIGGAVGATTAYLMKRGKAGVQGGPRLGEAAEMAYVPADCAGFVHLRLRDLWHTEGFAELRNVVEKAGPHARAALDENFVPAPSSIDRLTLVFVTAPPAPPPGGAAPVVPPRKGNQLPKGGFLPPPPAPADGGGFAGDVFPGLGGDLKVVVLLAFNAPFDAAKVRDTYLKNGTQKKVGDREYWDDEAAGFAAYFPSDTVMALGDGAGVKQYLAKLNTTAGPLAAAVKHARDGSRQVVAALNVAQLGPLGKVFDGAPDEYKSAARNLQTVLKAESLMVGLALAEETRIDVRAKYKDEAAAREGEAALRELAKFGREKLAEPRKQMEAALNGRPGDPKPRPIKDLPTAVLGLVGVGSLNTLDEWLAAPPLELDGSEVVLAPKVPSLTSAYASMAAVSLGFMLPAVEKTREAAGRAKDANNLKQIGLGMHGFHDSNGFFPAQDGKMWDRKGGLSWRVHLLPYIDQQALYNQFHLDEPWDSPHNKALVGRMPPTYASPLAADPPGQTRYKVFSGKDAVIFPGSKTTLVQITDGTSNTILVVGGGKPVVWTQPDDIEFAGTAAPAALALPGHTGCNVLMCDGSVRWVELGRLTPARLKAAITRNGGEVDGLDW